MTKNETNSCFRFFAFSMSFHFKQKFFLKQKSKIENSKMRKNDFHESKMEITSNQKRLSRLILI